MDENKSSTRVNFIEILRYIFSKFYWLCLAGTLSGAVVFGIVKFCVSPVYESRVSFYVYNSSDSSDTRTINNTDLQAAESLATTYSKILGSNSVLDAVISDLGNNKRNLTRKDLSKMTNAAVVTDTQLLEVVVSSTDAKFACEVANSFAKVAPGEMERITKVGGVEVVDQPEVATEPTSPRIMFDTLIGIAVGVLLAIVILIMRLVSDRTIYLPEDMEFLQNVTVLGSIPEIDVDKKSDDWILSSGDDLNDA